MSKTKASAAVLYAAKSTEDVHDSIPDQLKDGRAMAEAEGLEVIGGFQDEGFSGYSGNRGPGLKAAIEAAVESAQAGRETVLIVQHSDRISRGAGFAPDAPLHLVEYLVDLNRRGVGLRSVQDDYYRDSALAALMASVSGMRNTEDSRRKSQAVRAGMKRRAERGMFSGPRPYGYKYAKDGSGLVIEPREAALVKRIFSEYATGRSLTEIARGLHEDAVPVARGKKWRQSTVSGILSNPVYIGKVTYKGKPLDGVHKPLIEAGLWKKVADLLAARSGRNRGAPPKGRHLFRGGLLRCSNCGEAMVPRTNGGYEMYYCNGRGKLGREHCEMPHLRRADIDTAVLSYFEKVGLDVEATREALRESHDRKLAEVRTALRDAEREAQKARETFSRIRADYKRGDLPAKEWREEWQPELTEERQAAEAVVARLREQEADVASWSDLKDAGAETLRRLTEIRRAIAGEVRDAQGTEAVRAALARLFESFTVSIPKDGEAEITPKRRAAKVAFDFSDEANPEVQVLTPSRVALDLDNQRQGLPCR
jgi:site-specific DNA recombinase